MNADAATSEERALAVKVMLELLHRTAQPYQVKREYCSAGSLHFYLALREGFKLEKNEDHGGAPLELWPSGWTKKEPSAKDPVKNGRMLIWRRGRVIVKVKTHGQSGNSNYRAGSPHLSVCLVRGDLIGNKVDIEYDAELGKFSPQGLLCPRTPARNASKADVETWADDTHFTFPDLWCNDDGAEGLCQ